MSLHTSLTVWVQKRIKSLERIANAHFFCIYYTKKNVINLPSIELMIIYLLVIYYSVTCSEYKLISNNMNKLTFYSNCSLSKKINIMPLLLLLSSSTNIIFNVLYFKTTNLRSHCKRP